MGPKCRMGTVDRIKQVCSIFSFFFDQPVIFRDVIASCDQNDEVRVWTKQAGVEWESRVLRKYDYRLWDVSWRSVKFDFFFRKNRKIRQKLNNPHSVTGNVLAVSGGDNNVSLWRQQPDGYWKCISDSDAESSVQQGG